MMKKIALIRGKFLTKYDMEPFEVMADKYQFTVFGSRKSISDKIVLPIEKLWSPADFPDFPYKMPILNRMFIDAHYLAGLEKKLQGFDIAHSAETYYHYTQQALDAKKKGYVKKVIVSVLENIPFNNEGIWGRRNFKQRAMREADHFIALSAGAKNVLMLEGVSSDRISTVGFGIDTKKFYPAKKDKKEGLAVLFAGRIEFYKGIFDVLEVFKDVSSKNRSIKLNLTIIGKGSREKEMFEQIKKLGLTTKTIYKHVPYEKMAQEYRNADIFIGPSKKDKYWIEQFGMVFLEAMASGLPIITTKSGAIPEVVGDSALLSSEGDIQHMKSDLTKLIQRKALRENLSNKARKRAKDQFDVGVISKKIQGIYEKVL